jgi:hypothetical protein
MWTFQERIRIHHTHIREDKKRECQQIKKVLKRHGNILIVEKQRREKVRRGTNSEFKQWKEHQRQLDVEQYSQTKKEIFYEGNPARTTGAQRLIQETVLR